MVSSKALAFSDERAILMQGMNYFGDTLSTSGEPRSLLSVIDGEPLASTTIAQRAAVQSAIEHLQGHMPDKPAVFAFLKRLRTQLYARRANLLRLHQEETGFNSHDNTDAVEGIFDFLDHFEAYTTLTGQTLHAPTPHDMASRQGRAMCLVQKAAYLVAVMVPQNASIGLAVIALASALYGGSRVIIRPSLQCAASCSLLAEAIADSEPPHGVIAIVHCSAKDFLDSVLAAPHAELIHYIGSDRFASTVLAQAFQHGKKALVDGEGNGMLAVADDFPLESAANLICDGVTRFNGQTCTSINGVMIALHRLVALQDALVERFSALQLGDPRTDGVSIGPLFSRSQADLMLQRCRDSTSASLVYGGHVEGSLITPTIMVNPKCRDTMVREGFFGPLLWLAGVSEADWHTWLMANRFALSDTLLSHDERLQVRFVQQSRAGRICFNQDPSIESMFEPWGGYAPAASNPVSHWVHKYTYPVQLDDEPSRLKSMNRHYRS